MNHRETDIGATGRMGEQGSRRDFLGILPVGALALFASGQAKASNELKATMTSVSKDSVTDAGEPISYLSTPSPEISSAIMTIPSGSKTEWMTHPVQGYVYVLEGTLTVEFADGPRKVFKTGQGFPQARSKWHRGRNDGDTVVRFLAVFFGGKDVPTVLNPPKPQ